MKISQIAFLASLVHGKNKRPIYRTISEHPFDGRVMEEQLINERHLNNEKGVHPTVMAPTSANY